MLREEDLIFKQYLSKKAQSSAKVTIEKIQNWINVPRISDIHRYTKQVNNTLNGTKVQHSLWLTK